MLDAETVDLLESGCALIIGLATAQAEPYATRGWGLDLLDDGDRGRILIDTDDRTAIDLAVPGARIAVTGVDVPTLRGVQLKGMVVHVGPATEDDPVRLARYVEAFIDDVERTEGTRRDLLLRLVPVEVVTCVFTIGVHFDQTPGPAAGSPIGAVP